MSIYGIAISGLNAAQAGMATTSHNIANANTPGYSRQQIIQTSRMPQNIGLGFLGEGVDVANVVRRYDQFLTSQVLEAQTQSSNLNTQLDLAQQVSNLLGGIEGGMTPSMESFFTSVNAVANAPQSVPARQTMVSSAQALATSFQSVNQNLNMIRDGLNGRVNSSVNQVNSLATQIAKLNDQIVQMEASSPGQSPNDLLDQRDQLVNQLSQEVRVSTIKQSDGTLTVFIGSGQSLVLGTQVSKLKAVASNADPSVLEIAYDNNGTVIRIPQDSLQGGNIGGFTGFRKDVLDPAINALGRIAIGFAENFNKQQQQGIDLKGAFGVDLFKMASPSVITGGSNTGTGAITSTISNSALLTGNDYTVQFDGANYNVIDNSTSSLVQSFTPAQMAAGQTVTGIGITLQLTGAAASGDSFLVRPTVNGASGFALNFNDPTKIAAASPIRSNAPIANMGTGTIAVANMIPGVPVNANLQQTVTITFNNPPTTYNVTGTGTGNPVNVPYTAGSTITFNGWTTSISGKPSAGDTFTVAANTNSTTDGSNSLLMAALQTTNTLANSTTSFQGAYGQLIGQVGTQTNQLTVTSKAQTSLLNSVTTAQQAVSGVNLDEEAANLLRYQQAYQAAGKAMQIANNMFDTVLGLMK